MFSTTIRVRGVNAVVVRLEHRLDDYVQRFVFTFAVRAGEGLLAVFAKSEGRYLNHVLGAFFSSNTVNRTPSKRTSPSCVPSHR